jgi:high-affinity iron transporter
MTAVLASEPSLDLALGRQVYRANCLACHGANGDGQGPAAIALKPPPTDFSDPNFWRDRDADSLRDSLRASTRGSSPEPGFAHLSDAEISALASWLETLRPVAP